MNKIIKIMPEYECYPIWISENDGIFENINPQELEISKTLKSQIIEWDKQYEKTYNKQNPINSGFNDEEKELVFEKEGLSIWKKMSKELNEVIIIYRSILNDKELVSSDLKNKNKKGV